MPDSATEAVLQGIERGANYLSDEVNFNEIFGVFISLLSDCEEMLLSCFVYSRENF